MNVKFSSKFPKLTIINNRDKFLQEYVTGKTVLHGGCVDSELFGERIATKLLLHDILGATAKRLVGVDVDEEGINEMVKKTIAFKTRFLIFIAFHGIAANCFCFSCFEQT